MVPGKTSKSGTAPNSIGRPGVSNVYQVSCAVTSSLSISRLHVSMCVAGYVNSLKAIALVFLRLVVAIIVDVLVFKCHHKC